MHANESGDPNVALKMLMRKSGLKITDADLRHLDDVLASGANPNLQTSGTPALIRFIDHGFPPAAVETLLAHGADPNSRNSKKVYYRLGDGETALARAACSIFRAHSTDYMARLLESGADVNFQDSHGATVLDHVLAMVQREMDLCQWFPNVMSDFVVASTIRMFCYHVAPYLQIMIDLRSKGACPALSSAEAYSVRITQASERWNDGVRWLLEHEKHTTKTENSAT